MKSTFIICLILSILSCSSPPSPTDQSDLMSNDSLILEGMIQTRERSMIHKEIQPVMAQFSEDITWINSQGYFFKGIEEIRNFHLMMMGNDSLDYVYQAGKPRIRLIDSEHALAYYSWKMFWYQTHAPHDTVNREIGLMSLTARKINQQWKWIAVSNQHTPWFYESIEPVKIE